MPNRDVGPVTTGVSAKAYEDKPSTILQSTHTGEWGGESVCSDSVQHIRADDPPGEKVARVIKLSDKNINCWHVPVTCGGQKTDFLIDTGSTRSIVTLAYIRSLPFAPPMTETTWRLTDAQERDLPIVGQCHLLVSIGNRRFSAPFFVVDTSEEALNLIGSDFASQSGMVLNLRRGTLKWEDLPMEQPIPMARVVSNIDVSFLRAVEKTVVQAQTILPVQVSLQGDRSHHFKDKPALVETDTGSFEANGMVVQNGVVVPDSGALMIMVANPHNHDCVLDRGAIVGQASLVASVNKMPDTEEEFEAQYGPIISNSSNLPVHHKDPVTVIRSLDGSAYGCKGTCKSCPAYQRIVNCKSDASQQGGLESTASIFPPTEESVPVDKGKLPEHVQTLLEDTPIEEGKDPHIIRHLLEECLVLFQSPKNKLSSDTHTEHTITLEDSQQRPVKQQVRRVAQGLRKPVEAEVSKMLKYDYVSPSTSPWASPIVPVIKKDGTLRFCVDYRKLNSLTKKDAYPLPKIDELLEALRGAKYFCCLDLYSGYWQIRVAKQDREKTAFITHCGLYEFNVMPFGLTNAPATFQRYMDEVLKDLNGTICKVYLDDCIVFANTWEDMVQNLRTVFQRLEQYGLRLKASKCKLFQREVKFLGHVVSEKGISTDPDKTAAVTNFSIPRNIKDVRSFLGLTGYYRKFIPEYAHKAEPLFKTLRKDIIFYWGKDQQDSFAELKSALVTAPILAFPMDGVPYIVDTDASSFALGGVLSQVQDGHERVVAYASHTLNRAQRAYCATLRELLAVKFFVTEHWRLYLLWTKFTLRVDHSALTWLWSTRSEKPMYQRWFTALEEFRDYMTIVHRKGEKHGNADALSRLKNKCDSDTCPDCTLDPAVTPIIGEQFSDDGSSGDENEPHYSCKPKSHVTFASPETSVGRVAVIMTRSRAAAAKQPIMTRSRTKAAKRPQSILKNSSNKRVKRVTNKVPKAKPTPKVVALDPKVPSVDDKPPWTVLSYPEAISQGLLADPDQTIPMVIARQSPSSSGAASQEKFSSPEESTITLGQSVPTALRYGLPSVGDSLQPILCGDHSDSGTRSDSGARYDSGALCQSGDVEHSGDQPPENFSLPDTQVDRIIHPPPEYTAGGEAGYKALCSLPGDNRRMANLHSALYAIRNHSTFHDVVDFVMANMRALFGPTMGGKDYSPVLWASPCNKDLRNAVADDLYRRLQARGYEDPAEKVLDPHAPAPATLLGPPTGGVMGSVGEPLLALTPSNTGDVLVGSLNDSHPPPVADGFGSVSWSNPGFSPSNTGEVLIDSLNDSHPPPVADGFSSVNGGFLPAGEKALDKVLEPRVIMTRSRTRAANRVAETPAPEPVEHDPVPATESPVSVSPGPRRRLVSPPPPDLCLSDDDSEDDDFSAIVPSFTEAELREEQAADPAVTSMLRLLNTYYFKPNYEELKSELPDVRAMCQVWEEFEADNGLLYRNSKYGKVLVLPRGLRKMVMHEIHAGYTSGHPGITRMTKLVKQRFYWVGMKKDIDKWIKCCFRCVIAKRGPGRGKAPMQVEISGAPFDRCSFDIIGPLPQTARGNRFILTVVDYFSKWAEGYALPEHSATTVAWTLATEWISRFGTPLKFHCDKAPEFESAVLSQVFQMLGIKKTRTTAYRPQSNGLCERTNQTIENILKATVNGHCDDWDLHLPYALMSYRATPQSSTGLSPNMIVFGRETALPIDMMFRKKGDHSPWTNADGSSCFCSYVEWLRDTMSESFVTARDTMEISANRQKRYYDKDCKPRSFEIADWVMYHHKPTAMLTLSSGWVGPYVVCRKFNSVDYEIKETSFSTPIYTHVDNLMECIPNRGVKNFMSDQVEEGPKVFVSKKIQTKPESDQSQAPKKAKKRQVKSRDPTPARAKKRRIMPSDTSGVGHSKDPKKVKKGPDKLTVPNRPAQAAREFLSKSRSHEVGFRGFQTRAGRKRKPP